MSATNDARVLCPVCRVPVLDREYWSHAIRHQGKPIETRSVPVPREDDDESR